MKNSIKRVILSTVLMFAIILATVISNQEVQAKSRGITFNNKVFTKSLYKKTQKIGFGADGSMLISDQKYLKKIYRLLAGMELKKKEERDKEQQKEGFVTLVIHKKGGGKKTVTFQDDELHVGSSVYTIVKNNPLKKLQKIYTPNGKTPIYVECH